MCIIIWTTKKNMGVYMANTKLLNVKKLIGAFNLYLDSDNTKSFSDFVKSTKVGLFAQNTHINIMEFNNKKSKYEEFLNYLLENYDKYNGEKFKAIAIRQIRDECLDPNQKITVNSNPQELNSILAKKPVSTDNWHRTKYIARKTGKTLLSTSLLSAGIVAGLGLFAGWGVGFIPGMTGNVVSNLLNGLTNGAVFGAVIGPTYYVSSYLINKAKIKRLGKKDKENFNTINNFNLKTIADVENLHIPLMTLVHDFVKNRQISKELRTTKNPFKVAKHRKIRDLNYIRFDEISESFSQLIDSLVKAENYQNAYIMKEYYFDKFKSLFSHPDFARIASKFSIDKKLSSQNLVSRTITKRNIANNINSHDMNANTLAFNFVTKPAPIVTRPVVKPRPVTKPINVVRKKPEPVVVEEPSIKPEQPKKSSKPSTKVEPAKKPTTTSAKKPVAEANKKDKKAESNKPADKKNEAEKPKTELKPVKKSDKKTTTESVYPTTLFDLIEQKNTHATTNTETSNNPEAKSIKPGNNTSTQVVETKKKPTKRTSYVKKPNLTFENISKEAVLQLEDRIVDLLKNKDSNLRKVTGVSDGTAKAFIELVQTSHYGQDPITKKDAPRKPVVSIISKEKYKEAFKDLTDDEYKKIMNYAINNISLTDEP